MGIPHAIGPSRQTPQRLSRHGRVGVLAWGLDTGIPLTTVRATSLPLSAITMAVLLDVPVYAGLVYAVGFLSGLIVLSLSPKWVPLQASYGAIRWLGASIIYLMGTAVLLGVAT